MRIAHSKRKQGGPHPNKILKIINDIILLDNTFILDGPKTRNFGEPKIINLRLKILVKVQLRASQYKYIQCMSLYK